MLFDEPNEDNILQLIRDRYVSYAANEQMRMAQCDIDARAWANDYNFVGTNYGLSNFNQNGQFNNFYFNIFRQPVLTISGKQRQSRKSVCVIPVENGSQKTADQFSKLLQFSLTKRNILEKFSVAFQQTLITGLVLLQPYLDYSEDPVDGTLELKVWEFNSFMTDIFFRQPDMKDCGWVQTQEYITKATAVRMFPEKAEKIASMSPLQYKGNGFFFLPENFNITNTNRLILTHYWYQSSRKQKKLYNTQTEEITEWKDSEENIQKFLEKHPYIREIETTISTWKKATILNETLMYLGPNPLGFDQCPFIPMYFDYEPWQSQPQLRNRSLVTYLRSTQYLFNRRIILNHSISEISINSGFKYKEGSLVNEETMDLGNQFQNIIMKRSAEMSDCEKINATEVPLPNLELANQLQSLVAPISCINPSMMGSSSEEGLAGITEMLRTNAGIIALQKYYDQADLSLKLIAKVFLEIIQNNWSVYKVFRIIKEMPTEEFHSKNFLSYDVLEEEALNTSTQRQQYNAQLLKMNEMGYKVPIKEIWKSFTSQNKNELLEAMEEEERYKSEVAKQQQHIEMAILEARLQNLQADSTQKISLSRERYGRTKSNLEFRLHHKYSDVLRTTAGPEQGQEPRAEDAPKRRFCLHLSQQGGGSQGRRGRRG